MQPEQKKRRIYVAAVAILVAAGILLLVNRVQLQHDLDELEVEFASLQTELSDVQVRADSAQVSLEKAYVSLDEHYNGEFIAQLSGYLRGDLRCENVDDENSGWSCTALGGASLFAPSAEYSCAPIKAEEGNFRCAHPDRAGETPTADLFEIVQGIYPLASESQQYHVATLGYFARAPLVCSGVVDNDEGPSLGWTCTVSRETPGWDPDGAGGLAYFWNCRPRLDELKENNFYCGFESNDTLLSWASWRDEFPSGVLTLAPGTKTPDVVPSP